MSVMQYCWRCQTEVPMLDESEWAQLAPELKTMIRQIQEYREASGASLEDALMTRHDVRVLAKHFAITGVSATNGDALWHHRLSDYGAPCGNCGRLLRTKRARVCAECGANV
jgi:hypothetical protein